MIKVCMLTTQHSPKDDRIFYKEGLSLLKAGYDVTIICSADENGYIKDMGNTILNPDRNHQFEMEGIKVIGIKKSKSITQNLANKINLSKHFFDFVKKGIQINADIYHAHEPQSAYIAIKIQENTNAKVIFDAHEPWIKHHKKDWIIRKLILKKLKYIIAANHITRGDLLFHNHYLKSEVIYNCSPSNVFPPIFNKNKCENIIIVHEGGFWFDRGLKEIMEVLKLLKEDFPKIKFRIVGDTYNNEKKYLQDKINEYNLNKNVEQTGWLNYGKVHHYLKDCSIGLITNTPIKMNTLAGPANKFFNYLAYGIAIVAVDLPETSRFLNETRAGISIQKRTVENIYKTLKKLLEDKAMLKKYCQNSFEAYKQFNWHNEEKKLLSFYKDVVLNDTGIYYH